MVLYYPLDMSSLTERYDVLQGRLVLTMRKDGKQVSRSFTDDCIRSAGYFDSMKSEAIRAMSLSLDTGWVSADDPDKSIIKCMFCDNKSTDKETQRGTVPCYCRIPPELR